MKKINRMAILVPAVVGIWAMIGYQLYAYLHEPELKVPVSREQVARKERPDTVAYELIADYRDPFTERKSTSSSPTQNVLRKNVEGSLVPPKKPQGQQLTFDWPELTYQGMIQNNAAKSRIALIGRPALPNVILQEGEMLGRFKVIRVWNDSLMLQCDGQSKVYRRR